MASFSKPKKKEVAAKPKTIDEKVRESRAGDARRAALGARARLEADQGEAYLQKLKARRGVEAYVKAGKAAKAKANEQGKGAHAEEVKAEYNTRKKYPQMFEEGGKGKPKKTWGSPRKAGSKPKSGKTAATKSVQSALEAAGVSSKDMPSDVDKRKKKGK